MTDTDVAMSSGVAPGRGWRGWLDVVVMVLMGVAALMIIGVLARILIDGGTKQPPRPTEIPVPPEPVSLAGAPTLGSPAAPAVIMMFSEYECPYCARFEAEVMPELRRQFIETGRVQVAFRHLPLDVIHKFARPASLAAICAGEQARFWEMHAALFAQPASLDNSGVLSRVEGVGLDRSAFTACLDSSQARERVDDDGELAKRLGITGTPAFLVGRRLPSGEMKTLSTIRGARPLSTFVERVQAALSK